METNYDYMIAHYSKFNERAIIRVSEEDVLWLSSKWEWVKDERSAKRFYHQDDAEWALVLCKMKWFEIEKPKCIKQSWGELSSS